MLKDKMVYGIGSLSPHYYVSLDFPNKVITLKCEKEPYEIDKVLDKNIETMILIYEDRVRGWFLDFAREWVKEKNSEFLVLMICVNYLEGNQQFREGKASKGESTKMLKKALNRIFPETQEKIIDYLLDKVRHGLFHDGMTKKGILLRYGLSIPFFSFTTTEGEWIELDPSLFLNRIEIDFESYIQILKNKNNKKERELFDKHWKESYG